MQFKQRYLLYLLLAIVLGYLLVRFWFIIAWVLIAGVISLLGRPLMNLSGRLHIGRFYLPRFVRALFTLSMFYGVLALFVALFIPLLIEQAGLLATMDPARITRALSEPLADLEAWLVSMGFAEASVEQALNDVIQQMVRDFFSIGSLPDFLSGAVGFLTSFVISLFAITFMSFFFLKDDQLFYRMVMAATPDDYMDRVKRVLRNTKNLLTRYFAGIIVQVSLFTAVVTLGFTLTGNKYALLVGFVSGILNLIPYVGPLLAAVFGILVAVTTNLHLEFYNDLLWHIFRTYLVFFTAQVLDNYVFGPAIFGKMVRAHPIEIFTVVIVAGYLAGIPGMVIAIPTYTVIRIIAKEFLSEFKIVQKLTQNI
jgi:predicted PurR-regulated permease PerM